MFDLYANVTLNPVNEDGYCRYEGQIWLETRMEKFENLTLAKLDDLLVKLQKEEDVSRVYVHNMNVYYDGYTFVAGVKASKRFHYDRNGMLRI